MTSGLTDIGTLAANARQAAKEHARKPMLAYRTDSNAPLHPVQSHFLHPTPKPPHDAPTIQHTTVRSLFSFYPERTDPPDTPSSSLPSLTHMTAPSAARLHATRPRTP